MPDDTRLLQALDSLRERGAIGELSLPGAVAHAASFVAAVPDAATRLLDLGSGGGLPGLVIAWRCPHLQVVLTDRRERRTDLVRRAVSSLELQDRVTVLTGDVRALGRQAGLVSAFDVVTARAFGEPSWMLQCARPFLTQGGAVVVSEPPDAAQLAERWPQGMLDDVGFQFDAVTFPHVRRLIRSS